jgi:hypothetical protein
MRKKGNGIGSKSEDGWTELENTLGGGGICEQSRVLDLFGKNMGVFVNKVEF